MEAGIVGLPNVGKSTLFNALTASQSAQSENYPFCTIEPNEGIVNVPDDRLQVITKYIPPQKVIPAMLKLVDIAGIVKGASDGEGLGNKFLSHIRQVDAILQVVRCFEDPDVIHVSGTVDPLADIEIIETELMLADMQTLENAMVKAARTARSGDKEGKFTVSVIEKCNAHLSADQPLRTLELNENESKAIRSYGLLTAKPILFVANVGEDDLNGENELVGKVRGHAEKIGAIVVCVAQNWRPRLLNLTRVTEPRCFPMWGLANQRYATSLGKPTGHSGYSPILPPVRKRSGRGRSRLAQPRRRPPALSTPILSVDSFAARSTRSTIWKPTKPKRIFGKRVNFESKERRT